MNVLCVGKSSLWISTWKHILEYTLEKNRSLAPSRIATSVLTRSQICMLTCWLTICRMLTRILRYRCKASNCSCRITWQVSISHSFSESISKRPPNLKEGSRKSARFFKEQEGSCLVWRWRRITSEKKATEEVRNTLRKNLTLIVSGISKEIGRYLR